MGLSTMRRWVAVPVTTTCSSVALRGAESESGTSTAAAAAGKLLRSKDVIAFLASIVIVMILN
jgi:hypothetical protein